MPLIKEIVLLIEEFKGYQAQNSVPGSPLGTILRINPGT
jgi:hypothetical protein